MNKLSITSKIIENAIYNLCVEANTTLNDDVFAKILDAYENEKNLDAKQALKLILKNAKMSFDTKKPLCQDTGQVLVFAKIPQNIVIEGKNINDAINEGVLRAYEENFYRKSVVKNTVFDRTNTKTNTPCIIYTEIIDGDVLELELLIKGAGAENMSAVSMMSPTASEAEIIDFVKSVVLKAGANACPPFFIGVGIGGTIEYAGLLSKKALMLSEDIDENHKILAKKIMTDLNSLSIGAAGFGGAYTALDVKVLTDFTHIASMPIAVTINCHSSRHAKCEINKNVIVGHPQKLVANYVSEEEDFSDFIKVETSDIATLKSLKQGQKVLLSGDVFTARDMAHKKLVEMIENGEELPFDLKNKIIFYAGPCPCKPGEIIGSVGPTTASRMDKFAPVLYQSGVLGTIGKGGRSEEVLNSINESQGLYFTLIGGIACYLSNKVVKKELVAFEELGTEAVFKLIINELPLFVDFC